MSLFELGEYVVHPGRDILAPEECRMPSIIDFIELFSDGLQLPPEPINIVNISQRIKTAHKQPHGHPNILYIYCK
jgi:hypothetical protein